MFLVEALTNDMVTTMGSPFRPNYHAFTSRFQEVGVTYCYRSRSFFFFFVQILYSRNEIWNIFASG